MVLGCPSDMGENNNHIRDTIHSISRILQFISIFSQFLFMGKPVYFFVLSLANNDDDVVFRAFPLGVSQIFDIASSSFKLV